MKTIDPVHRAGLPSVHRAGRPARIVAVLLGSAWIAAACSNQSTSAGDGRADGAGADGGPASDGSLTDGDAAAADAPHNLDEIAVEGTVTLGFGFGSPATGVKVTARCGSRQTEAATDDQGRYGFVADVKGCTPLVIEFDKESYLPNYRILHLPPPTSPVTVDVPLAELYKLVCGSYRCLIEDNLDWHLPNEPMRQGWATTMAGAQALDFVGGEFRQQDGKLIGLVGFAYFDFRDQNGIYLDKVTPFKRCIPVPHEALDWLGDVQPTGDPETDTVDMRWYRLDPTTGRWRLYPELAQASYLKGYFHTVDSETRMCTYTLDPEGNQIEEIVPAYRSQLADIRAGTFVIPDECMLDDKGQPMPRRVDQFYVCGWFDGSGWFAWGIDMAERSCFSLQVTNQCNAPLPNVVFSVTGRDHGYRAEAWTDWNGEACLEVIPSEPVGHDYDADGLAGETFWVDVDLSWASTNQHSILSHKNPQPAPPGQGCAQPETCTPLEHTFHDYGAQCP